MPVLSYRVHQCTLSPQLSTQQGLTHSGPISNSIVSKRLPMRDGSTKRYPQRETEQPI